LLRSVDAEFIFPFRLPFSRQKRAYLVGFVEDVLFKNTCVLIDISVFLDMAL